MPASIRPNRAASISRSTVHHQAAKGVRSTRETMELPPPGPHGPCPYQSCLVMVDGALTSGPKPLIRRSNRACADVEATPDQAVGVVVDIEPGGRKGRAMLIVSEQAELVVLGEMLDAGRRGDEIVEIELGHRAIE